MKHFQSLAASALALMAWTALAAVSPEEAARLGKDLTFVGAEKAGNKDGTIPEFTGGLTTPPADYKAGSGIYVDPFKDEKPLFSITAQNMAQYADKLTEGQKLMLQRQPAMRMDIYPTHRTMALPQRVLDITLKNATTAKTTAGGLGIEPIPGGLPFPIPKDGNEVMWNHLLAYQGDVIERNLVYGYAGSDGRFVLTANSFLRAELPYYQPDHPLKDKIFFQIYASPSAPGGLAGQQQSYQDPLDFSKADRRAFQYIPSQRRVKLAPEFSYDTPNPGGAGIVTFDDVSIFSGKMDRYNFKLIGKKEVYMPYSNYKLFGADRYKTLDPGHFKNELMRYELHRVWVVEATLLPGKRHIYKKRVFYWDEDNAGIGMSDEYDNAGKLLRFGMTTSFQLYDKEMPFTFDFTHYDFSSNVLLAELSEFPIKAHFGNGPALCKIWSAADWSQDAMAGRGVR